MVTRGMEDRPGPRGRAESDLPQAARTGRKVERGRVALDVLDQIVRHRRRAVRGRRPVYLLGHGPDSRRVLEHVLDLRLGVVVLVPPDAVLARADEHRFGVVSGDAGPVRAEHDHGGLALGVGVLHHRVAAALHLVEADAGVVEPVAERAVGGVPVGLVYLMAVVGVREQPARADIPVDVPIDRPWPILDEAVPGLWWGSRW